MSNNLYVIKRDNKIENVKFDKISARLEKLANEHPALNVNHALISQLTINGLYSGIKTEKLDHISATIAEGYKLVNPGYSDLAKRILVSNLHKTTPDKFSDCVKIIKSKIRDDYYEFVMNHADELDAMVDHRRDYNLSYMGFKIMEHAYLISSDKIVIERPQYLYMRVAIAVNDATNSSRSELMENIKKTYDLISNNYYTHATPCLINACRKNQQLNSCFVLGTGDCIEDIMQNATDCSYISKRGGGIGVFMHNIRCAGSVIKSTDGISDGLPAQLSMYNSIAKLWTQGGARPGAISIYLEPWHGDILKLLELKLITGNPDEKTRDIFYAIWMNDLFMKRWHANKKWSLFNSDLAKGLDGVFDGMKVCKNCNNCSNIDYNEHIDCIKLIYDVKEKCNKCNIERRDVFTDLYEYYEKNNIGVVKTINPKEIVDAICESFRDCGTPYILHKDNINRMSNQDNIGTIKGSNLCAEIVEFCNKMTYACCNLSSINLRKYVVNGVFDHQLLHDYVRIFIRNMDKVIDVNDYPVSKAKDNALKYRPLGIGIQGLADLFIDLNLPYLSDAAEKLDLEITETIYHAALTESCQLAKEYGPYDDFKGSPASEGILQFDMWKENQVRVNSPLSNYQLFSGMYNWDELKQDIVNHGLRNSLLVAFMPTATTSHFNGNTESYEPISNCIYSKKTKTGIFTMTIEPLINKLIDLGIWNESLKNKIVNNGGSVQGIKDIPTDIQELYLTVWEMKQSLLMRRSALRQAFIDQSQSNNIYAKDKSNAVLRGVINTGWKYGMKTGSYYVRTLIASEPMKNNIASSNKVIDRSQSDSLVCYNKEDCMACSS